MLVVAERPRTVAAKVESAEAHRPHLEREAEDGPNSARHGRRRECLASAACRD